jgi:hypothetical protein
VLKEEEDINAKKKKKNDSAAVPQDNFRHIAFLCTKRGDIVSSGHNEYACENGGVRLCSLWGLKEKRNFREACFGLFLSGVTECGNPPVCLFVRLVGAPSWA